MRKRVEGKCWRLFGMACCLSLFSFAQDIQFSQFYAIPTYQNPAFAGSAGLNRLVLHQRLQWRSLDARYSSSLASWDRPLPKIRGGIGAHFVHDYQGGDKIVSNEFALLYAQEIAVSSAVGVRLGAQLGGGTRTVDYAQFRYAQDYNNQGFQGTTYSQFGDNTLHYFDLATGGVVFTDHLWFGMAAHHLNRPVQTFYNSTERWPVLWKFSGGYKFVVHQERSKISYHHVPIEYTVVPSVLYKLQGKSDQLDLGLYSQMHRLLLGIWYRGLPFKRYDAIQNNESAAFLVGLKYHNLVMTYSFDATMSRLVRAQTGGAHEFNLTIYWDRQKQKRKPMKRLPCPDYFD